MGGQNIEVADIIASVVDILKDFTARLYPQIKGETVLPRFFLRFQAYFCIGLRNGLGIFKRGGMFNF
jgi:hypothetical protein